MTNQLIDIPVNDISLIGELSLIPDSKGLIIFSHGSGSSRVSPRNRYIAHKLNDVRFSTLLFDLLTPYEDQTRASRFDIDLLSERLQKVTEWLKEDFKFRNMSFGYFGASTGAASAIRAAIVLGEDIVQAVVSRGGRPDMAFNYLNELECPVLLLVGEKDAKVLELNQKAYEVLSSSKKISLIPRATHLFEKIGTLEQVAEEATEWFQQYLLQPTTQLE